MRTHHQSVYNAPLIVQENTCQKPGLPPLLSDDEHAVVISSPCCGASPGRPVLALSRKTGLNANTVPRIQHTGEDALEPASYWHGSPFTRMHRDGTKEEALQKSHSGRQNSETQSRSGLSLRHGSHSETPLVKDALLAVCYTAVSRG